MRALGIAGMAFGLVSGCSLFLDEAPDDDDGEPEPNDDAGPIGDHCTPFIDCPVAQIVSTIGTNNGRDFATIGTWIAAREGNFTQRYQLEISGDIEGLSPGPIVGQGGDCSGNLISERDNTIVEIDFQGDPCEVGSVLMVGDARIDIVGYLGQGAVEIGELYDDSGTGIDASVTFFDAPSSTIESAHWVLRAGPNEGHDGDPDQGVVIRPVSPAPALTIRADFTRIEGIRVGNFGAAGGLPMTGISVTANDVVLDRVIVGKAPEAPLGSFGIDIGGDQVRVFNSLVHEIGGICMRVRGVGSIIAHTTIVDCREQGAAALDLNGAGHRVSNSIIFKTGQVAEDVKSGILDDLSVGNIVSTEPGISGFMADVRSAIMTFEPGTFEVNDLVPLVDSIAIEFPRLSIDILGATRAGQMVPPGAYTKQ